MRVRELRLSYVTPAAASTWDGRAPILTGADAAAVLAPLLRDQASEVFAVLCLTTRNRVICYHEVSRGTIDGSMVRPAEVYRAAMLANAAQVIVAHNHPSGDAEPSREDVDVTRRLAAVGAALGLPLLDHIIIGAAGFCSLRDRGEL